VRSDHGQHAVLWRARIRRFQGRSRQGIVSVLPWWVEAEDKAAADRAAAVADDEAVSLSGNNWPSQPQLCPATASRSDLTGLQQDDPCGHFGCAEVERDGAVVAQGPIEVGQGGKAHFHRSSGGVAAGLGDHHAPLKVIGGDAGQVECSSAARPSLLDFMVVVLNPPDPRGKANWQNLHGFAHPEGAVDQCARYHGAESGHRKGAVHRQPRAAPVRLRLGCREE
jgi:hypothetical protein